MLQNGGWFFWVWFSLAYGGGPSHANDDDDDDDHKKILRGKKQREELKKTGFFLEREGRWRGQGRQDTPKSHKKRNDVMNDEKKKKKKRNRKWNLVVCYVFRTSRKSFWRVIDNFERWLRVGGIAHRGGGRIMFLRKKKKTPPSSSNRQRKNDSMIVGLEGPVYYIHELPFLVRDRDAFDVEGLGTHPGAWLKCEDRTSSHLRGEAWTSSFYIECQVSSWNTRFNAVHPSISFSSYSWACPISPPLTESIFPSLHTL
jgi:hypothetical protein